MNNNYIKESYIYTRVSTTEQAVEGYSIEEQERMCKAAIESKGWQYAKTYFDPGVSGRTLERDGIQRMIVEIKERAKEVNVAVFIYKLDRLSRKQRDTMAIIEDVFLENNIDLVSLNETLDTSTPWGRAMIGILSSFNQMESENIQERTLMGRKAKAQKGGYAGGKPPLGYKVVEGELVIDEKEAELVRKIFDLRWKGETLVDITTAINREGYKTKRGKLFRHSAIANIIKNEKIYRGAYQYGDENFVENQHEPILTKEAPKNISYKDRRRKSGKAKKDKPPKPKKEELKVFFENFES